MFGLMQTQRALTHILIFGASSAIVSSCAMATDDYTPVDAAKAKITLQRSACFGTCPDYKVTIQGDGRVSFTTATAPADPVSSVHREFSMSQGVLFPGTHEDRIAPDLFAALVAKFRSAGFYNLKREYVAGVTDSATYKLTFDTGRKSKVVTDYVGREVGMPKAVTDLENAVDELAGTARWVRGSAKSYPLAGEAALRFPFSQRRAARGRRSSGQR